MICNDYAYEKCSIIDNFDKNKGGSHSGKGGFFWNSFIDESKKGVSRNYKHLM